MKKCAFISHSSKDSSIANKVCFEIEEADLSCWIAPRDIPPGSDWDVAIVEALESTSAIIILFSSKTFDSKHVKREIEIAADYNKMLLPVRIEDVYLDKRFRYYLHGKQWTDLLESPFDKKIQPLIQNLKQLCKSPDNDSQNVDTEFIEPILLLLASSAHAHFSKGMLSKEFKKLPPHYKTNCINFAKGIIKITAKLGLKIVPKIYSFEAKEDSVNEFIEKNIELFAESEHDNWMKEKINNGWIYGHNRNDSKKIHNALLPYNQLSEQEKEKDLSAVQEYASILSAGGFKLIK